MTNCIRTRDVAPDTRFVGALVQLGIKKNPELFKFRARLELATYRYMHFAICRSTAELPEPDLEEYGTESRI